MSNIVLNKVTTGYNISNINANFDKLQDKINNDTLSRSDGGNVMYQDLDMNSFRLLNAKLKLAPPVFFDDAVRLTDLNTEISSRISDVTNLQKQITTLASNQVSGFVGYPTLAALNADLSRTEGTVALVTNDPIASNNTSYRKVGPPNSGSWVMAVDRITNLSNTLSASTGSTSVGFLQLGTGASTRSVQDKLRETISVKDYGAKGDGITDDSAAIQVALNAAGALECGLYFPSGTYIINTGVTLPAANITLYGNKGASVITGTAANLITYPSATSVSGNVKVQNIDGLKFIIPGDGTAINCTQTWDGAGKAGPSITNCSFFHSSATTTSATSIKVSGMWSGLVQSCFFVGKGSGGGPTNGIGGYGIHVVLTSDMNSSVMNFTISNNIFACIANPIRFEPRVVGTGGRVEGCRIIGNNLIAGNIGIYSQATNNMAIIGNQIDDFDVAVRTEGDFDYLVSGNHLGGVSKGLWIAAITSSFAERITITGNKIYVSPTGIGIVLTNTIGNDFIRAVTITGNTISASSLSTGQGIAVQGNATVSDSNYTGNAFQYFQYAIWFSGLAHTIKLSNNSYSLCTTPVFNGSTLVGNPSTNWGVTRIFTLTGGSGSEVITVPVTPGIFAQKPDAVSCVTYGDNAIGFYDWDNSTATSLKIIVRPVDGGNLGPGAHRFFIIASGIGN